MTPKKKEQPISIKFVILFTVAVIALLVYATTPNDMKKIETTKTFEEMLEYSTNVVDSEELRTEKIQSSQLPESQRLFTQVSNSTQKVENKEKKQTKNDEEKYNELLDKLKQYPTKSITSVELIVKDILRYKGFPENIVKIISENETNLKQKTKGSYIAASFNLSSGEMHINKHPLYNLSIEEIVAIIAHELDHFEKVAQVCKYTGISEFNRIMNENKMLGLNYEFWGKAQKYANIENFKGEEYKEALIRYISQGSIDLTSSYSDLYRLAEHVRNPLEISAYDVSDYIYDYYGLPKNEGPLRKLIEKFNKVDWSIYNLIKNDKILNDERIAIFDYFFSQAIISGHPKYKERYDYCISERNGDLTEFWLSFEKDHMSFYDKTQQMDGRTYKNISFLLDKIEELSKKGITKQIVTTALKNKVNTLLSNIVFPNATKFIRITALDYLTYSKANGIYNAADELKMLFTLICLDNNLYTNSQEETPSLYYIKFPEEVMQLYKIDNKKRYHFIYQNEEFKKILKERQETNPSLTEQQLVSNLLNEHKLNSRINTSKNG